MSATMAKYWRWLLSSLLALILPAAFPGETPTGPPAKLITQYVLDVWQIDDGLPSNHVLDILRTRDGYLWLATRGGLVRFDGVRFRIFNKENTPAFETDDFGCLAEGQDGTVLAWDWTPAPGETFWFVARPVAEVPGSYDSYGLAQEGTRDEGINASGAGCP